MDYMLYRTICLITGKIYYGVHGTDNIDDGYLGSGVLLIKAIKKHGRENFVRQIVYLFDEKEIAYSLERQLVDKRFLQRSDVYNRCEGGTGGKDIGILGGAAMKEKFKDTAYALKWAKDRSDDMKAYCAKNGSNFKGKRHSDQVRKKQSDLRLRKFKEGLMQRRLMNWVFNEDLKLSKYVLSTEVGKLLLQGWQRGRRMKF